MPGPVLWNLITTLFLCMFLLVFGAEMPEGLRSLLVLCLAGAGYAVWLWWSAPPRRPREGDVPGQWRTPDDDG